VLPRLTPFLFSGEIVCDLVTLGSYLCELLHKFFHGRSKKLSSRNGDPCPYGKADAVSTPATDTSRELLFALYRR
jgi:hypothetical protein